MPTTRSFISLGVWAENADTVIPPTPIPGTPYRNVALTAPQNEAGIGFQNGASSADFNQKMFIISSFTDMINEHGIPGWSDQVTYNVPAVVWADDGAFYFALQTSTGQDPVTSPADWQLVAAMGNLQDETLGTEGSRLIGHTGATAASYLPFAAAKIDGAGNIIDSLNIASTVYNGTGNVSVTFTNTQPNANYWVQATCDITGLTFDPHVVNVYNPSTTGFLYQVWEVNAASSSQDCAVVLHCYPNNPLTP